MSQYDKAIDSVSSGGLWHLGPTDHLRA